MRADSEFEVLLSTFNGQQFLLEQLESIEAQTVDGIRLRVRDDGSTDGTPKLLEAWGLDRDWVSVDRGSNLGVGGSFLWLLGSVDKDVKWVAFCDQDDIWDRGKLARAKNALQRVEGTLPAMYFSSVWLVDASRKVIGKTSPCTGKEGFLNALTQNIASGCTIVLNRAAVDLLVNRSVNKDRIGMHDRWVYLVVSAFGKVVCDPEPTMEYRQHAGNVVGFQDGWVRWIRRLSRFRRRRRTQLVDYANELLRTYGEELPFGKKRVCEEFVEGAGSSSLYSRLRYAWRTPVLRQNTVDDFLMRVLIVLGWR